MGKLNKESISVVEKLIKNYKVLCAEQTNLNMRLKMIAKQRDSMIEGKQLSASHLSDMPANISFRHYYNLIDVNNEEYKETESEKEFIHNRLEDLDSYITIIESSLNSLNEVQRSIVLRHYCDKKSLYEVSLELNLEQSWIFKLKSLALFELYKSLYIFDSKNISLNFLL